MALAGFFMAAVLKSENLHVVDGTQPGSVNMGIAQMDWEKVVIASTRIKAEYLPKVERKQGVGCVIDDLSALQAGDEDDEMMELWWGDEARKEKKSVHMSMTWMIRR